MSSVIVIKSSPSQHVALFRVFQDQHQLVDTVDLVLDTLNQRAERIGNVVNQRIRDPVGRDGNVILEVFDAASNVLRVWRASEVELPHQLYGYG